MSADAPLLAVRQLGVDFRVPGRWPWSPAASLRAVDEVNLNLHAGETLGVVGESGCGKSTLARCLAGLQVPTRGAIVYRGQDLARCDERAWRGLRREIQIVFQDPLASLDPRMSIGASVEEPLLALCPELSAAARATRVRAMLERVGLAPELAQRYPHEFSGGQCQRAGIARALIVQPKILICDEPVSALDVSVQAQIVNLLGELQRERGLSMIFIAHDLAVVRHLSRRVLVMYLGRVMEQAASEDLFAQPMHPYTRALLASRPGADPALRRLHVRSGEQPSPLNPPLGCVFVTRCPMADEQCTRRAPPSQRLRHGGSAACHYVAAE